MNDVGSLLLGAALVVLGVLAAALADRIRSVRIREHVAPRNAAVTRRPTRAMSEPDDVMHQQVVGALVTAGYPKRVATAAAAACAPEQRITAETWTRAALRGCTQERVPA